MRVTRWVLCSMILIGWSLIAVAASYDELKPLLSDIVDWKAEVAD